MSEQDYNWQRFWYPATEEVKFDNYSFYYDSDGLQVKKKGKKSSSRKIR